MLKLLREQFAITCSTLLDIAGFDMLKLKKQHYDHYHKGISLPPPSEEVQKTMDQGTDFEYNMLLSPYVLKSYQFIFHHYLMQKLVVY